MKNPADSASEKIYDWLSGPCSGHMVGHSATSISSRSSLTSDSAAKQHLFLCTQVPDLKTSEWQALYPLIVHPTIELTQQFQPQGHHGIQPIRQQQPYKTYRSPYGPEYVVTTRPHPRQYLHIPSSSYKVRPNFHGIDLPRVMR